MAKMTSPESDAAKALGEATSNAEWGALYESGKTMFRFSSVWTTDVVEAKTLAMFAYMLKARRVMEIGMFTGCAPTRVGCALAARSPRSPRSPPRSPPRSLPRSPPRSPRSSRSPRRRDDSR